MNTLSLAQYNRACEEAVYNLYLYATTNHIPEKNICLGSLVEKLKNNDDKKTKILKKACENESGTAKSILLHFIYIPGGITACVFIRPDEEVSFVFKGTASGEWIDNGKGLSGIPQKHKYIKYDYASGKKYDIVKSNDFSTTQQVQALNIFNGIIFKDKALHNRKITVSGHSKGGNKAQFIAMKSDSVKSCFSFNGQGFSPEAIKMFESESGSAFWKKCDKIKSLCSENDYVNVLGKRLVYDKNTYYFSTHGGIHPISSLMNTETILNPYTGRGLLSDYISSLSDKVMSLAPSARKYATLGIMNIFQKYISETNSLNDDIGDIQSTISEISVAANKILKNIGHDKFFI